MGKVSQCYVLLLTKADAQCLEMGRARAELISKMKAFFAGRTGLRMAFKAALLDRGFLLLLGLPAAVFLRVLCPSPWLAHALGFSENLANTLCV